MAKRYSDLAKGLGRSGGVEVDGRQWDGPDGSRPEDEVMRLRGEVFELQSIVGRLQSELMEARLSAARGPVDLSANAEIRSLRAGLNRASEALVQASATIREAETRSADLAEVVRHQTQSLRRKDVLMGEVDHRVKNGLQTLQALIRIEARRHQDNTVRDFLDRICSRITALTEVHAILHLQNRWDGLDFGTYVRAVCDALGRSMSIDGHSRVLTVEVESVDLAPEVAQALGLMVNELVTNAFRHAFAPGADGTVLVRGRRTTDGRYRLTIADDGRGLPDGFALGSGDGLGQRLVTMLSQQLDATVEVVNHEGARFTITLPVPHDDGGNGMIVFPGDGEVASR